MFSEIWSQSQGSQSRFNGRKVGSVKQYGGLQRLKRLLKSLTKFAHNIFSPNLRRKLKRDTYVGILALLHFRTPPIVIDDSSWKNVAESFTVALTLTLGGYESAIASVFSMENPHASYSYSCKAFDCLLYLNFSTYLLRRDLNHQFCQFQQFLVNFLVKVICFILITQNTPAGENLSECELMLVLVWTNSSICRDNTKSCLALKKFLCHFLSINSQNAMDSLLFKNKTWLIST